MKKNRNAFIRYINTEPYLLPSVLCSCASLDNDHYCEDFLYFRKCILWQVQGLSETQNFIVE